MQESQCLHCNFKAPPVRPCIPQIGWSCTCEANRDAGAKFAPGRTGKTRGPAGLQQKERLKADPMAEFRPSQTVGFIDYTDDGVSDAMSRPPVFIADHSCMEKDGFEEGLGPAANLHSRPFPGRCNEKAIPLLNMILLCINSLCFHPDNDVISRRGYQGAIWCNTADPQAGDAEHGGHWLFWGS